MYYPNLVPYVPIAGAAAGIGQVDPALDPSLKWWQRIIVPVGQAVGQAAASRIAYGQTYPTGPSGVLYQGPRGPGALTAWGGFDPKLLLGIGAVAVLALVLARRR